MLKKDFVADVKESLCALFYSGPSSSQVHNRNKVRYYSRKRRGINKWSRRLFFHLSVPCLPLFPGCEVKEN